MEDGGGGDVGWCCCSTENTDLIGNRGYSLINSKKGVKTDSGK